MPVSGIVKNVHIGPTSVINANGGVVISIEDVPGVQAGWAGFVAPRSPINFTGFDLSVVDVIQDKVKIQIVNRSDFPKAFDEDLKVVVIGGQGAL